MLTTVGKEEPALNKELLLKNLHMKWAQCRHCPELKSHIQFPITCHGNVSSGMMLVSEGAYIKSIQEGRYFTRGFLRDALPNLEDYCYLTDVIKCDSCGIKSKKLADRCYDHLVTEIDVLHPRVILAVGSLPFLYLTGEKGFFIQRHGTRKQYYHRGIETIPIIHPSRANVYYPGNDPVNDYKLSLRRLMTELADELN